ncbi:MbcA/ParS/Xre antitoxin family protein [Deinococcus roseus]|uniref:Antitoxin Xre/MbcA/ParS-like toxin-binding domain-containing protein n=1 Tax=Deinococcus roseus TaxID=392414 RepID=A0ABQ2DGX3_9DEIO|nr:MbcA/ParS/Xre antitoxin family protein [Deinococcus roseus]GGJ55248.1 hypothetical protein GCM10008938_46750 [Deinococcus roseus]
MNDALQGLRRTWLEVHQELQQDLPIWQWTVLGQAQDPRTQKRQLRVLSLSVLVFGDVFLALRWLYCPQGIFEDTRPLEMLQTQEGRRQVVRVLLRFLPMVNG